MTRGCRPALEVRVKQTNARTGQESREQRVERRGGRRPGAGRKRTSIKTPHRRRPSHSEDEPLHLTLRVREGLPPLREPALYAAIERAIAEHSEGLISKAHFRVLHFSVQTNHLHFLIEARDKRWLSLGARGLVIRIAKAINRCLEICGPVFESRYHSRALRDERDVRWCLVYVLMNARKHGRKITFGIDPYSSAAWFDGFSFNDPMHADDKPVDRPRSWLARRGWRALGLIEQHERPRGAPD